jgi:cholest-4-en-3-one 26-monooxygenase
MNSQLREVQVGADTVAGPDVLSTAQYVDGVPHDLLAVLRRTRPVYLQQIADPNLIDHAWVLTRHADVVAVSGNHDDFTSRDGFSLHRKPVLTGTHLLDTDAEEHRRLRQLVARGFTPRVVSMFIDHYRKLVAGTVNQAVGQGCFDFVDDLAAKLPAEAICELMGVPASEQRLVVRAANALTGDADPEYAGSGAALRRHYGDLLEYLDHFIRDKAGHPDDDLTTQLLGLREADAVTDNELLMFLVLLLTGGTETTRHAISHGLLALLEHPDQLKQLRGHLDTGLDRAVEEILRWAHPIIYMARRAVRDVDVAGVQIPAGDWAAMFYAAANRDPEVFPDPQRFDITRVPNAHLTFGSGPHYCLGSALARVEIKAVFAELLPRVKNIELAGDVVRLQSSFVHGIKHLPVAVSV